MDRTTEAALQRLTEALDPADEPMMQRMLAYLNRNSLLLAAHHGTGDDLVCDFANDCERLRIPVTALRDLHAGLLRGEAIDWEQLERVK